MNWLIIALGLVVFIFLVIKAAKYETKKKSGLISQTSIDKKEIIDEDQVKIRVDQFKDNLLAIPRNVHDKITSAILKGKQHVYISETDYNFIIENIKKEEIKKRNEAYFWELKKNAEVEEKNKNFEEAVKIYEQAVDFAIKNNFRINSFAHAVERLVINYRKTKQEQKEVDILTYMLENYSNWNHSQYDKWNERLAKLI